MPQDANYWRERPADDPKKDWAEGDTWLEGYEESINHPHRDLIIGALSGLDDVDSVLEIGCNVGPNLKRIGEVFPWMRLTGIDVSEAAIERSHAYVPGAMTMLAEARELPFLNNQFDVVLADAALMYVPDTDITCVMDEITRVASKYVILVEWHHPSQMGKEVEHHWARNYKLLLENRRFDVADAPITNEDWPTEKWSRLGRFYVAKKHA